MKTKFRSRSAFLNAPVLLLFGLGVFSGASALGQGPGRVQVGFSYHNDVSRPLREMAAWNPADIKQEHEANQNPKIPIFHEDSAAPLIHNRHASVLGFLAPHIPSPSSILTVSPFQASDVTAHRPIRMAR